MKHVRDVRKPGLIYQAWSIKPIFIIFIVIFISFFGWTFSFPRLIQADALLFKGHILHSFHSFKVTFCSTCRQVLVARQFVFVPTFHSTAATCMWKSGKQEVEEYGGGMNGRDTSHCQKKYWEKKKIRTQRWKGNVHTCIPGEFPCFVYLFNSKFQTKRYDFLQFNRSADNMNWAVYANHSRG